MLMHISTLLKYDAVLGSEWLKWMKLHLVPNQFLLQVRAEHRLLGYS